MSTASFDDFTDPRKRFKITNASYTSADGYQINVWDQSLHQTYVLKFFQHPTLEQIVVAVERRIIEVADITSKKTEVLKLLGTEFGDR